MKSNLISKSETSALLKTVSEEWGIELPKIKNLKVHQILDDAQIITGRGIKILKINEDYLPFLSETDTLEKFPSVTVDMGAVKFMCKGANLMRPGIRSFTEFEKDKLVCIVEESQHKFLAVGKSVVSSDEAEKMGKGEVVKNLHYISDKFWETGKTIYD
ncbi:putative tRNA pseudouridine synthase B protein [Marine Group I thaumarchaeote SCGC AAA799-E16]|uniref:Phosphoadenosine phosphosulfate reductase protein n=4 Tax=Marine Group I TaxID=905826 RepID=A0A087RYD1_9ARCH|nr:putative tRNA pseudouridine synthase B protein [Marine Group I thaumarchaeote SCGC AAA799-N04]KER06553.1 putative tRNA pseudouridine synthase B protein [Marine Group I thaumarchaeote SCGC AAA799-E16]KFM18485.1 phosphoadenosine phosphosulfate reductase protein [Marine Group I thaumarchaeote SCGC RSA3]KFM22254.1 putative tRNA pseudouridine synthase B protein [Marine Group I thaumarchaeote SCGC AAA799-B03]